MQRRRFLASMAATAALRAANGRPPVVMLRSGWQSVNIGDIAHTPGVLAILEKHIPDVELILWPVEIERGTEPMLRSRFPKLQIVRSTDDVHAAFKKADLFVHGSAASIGSHAQIESWRETGKPYGFFGVGFTMGGEATSAAPSAGTMDMLNHAAFIFTRETASLANLKRVGVTGPELAFAPDGTFSMDILDEERGAAYVKESGLEPGKFLCVIPRLRYTPYHLFKKMNWSEAEIKHKMDVNERWAEKDHAKLREAAIAWVRKTGGKVLFCPEMTYQLDIIDKLLYDPLPDDVKKQVVRRNKYWLPDEASSVYKRAAAVLSCECHSPILAAAVGTPCMYVHQPEDGIKGHMWEDVGLKHWYFEIEETSGQTIAERALEIRAQGEAARRKVREADSYARKVQGEKAEWIRTKVLRG
jgi:polysaccharide pyruvyl transferase WcaK-like protein